MSTETPVVIAGWIDYEAADREAVLEQFAAVARQSRTEPGCIDYAVSADLDDERRIRVLEHWSSDAALEEHFATAHVQEFRASSAGYHRLGRSLQKHYVASSEPMASSSSAARSSAS